MRDAREARLVGAFGLVLAFLAATGAIADALAATADVFKSIGWLWFQAGLITVTATTFYGLERRLLG